jgi:hypothetical protein
MMVLHIDGYQAGKETGFEGSTHYLVACCGMCTFAAMNPIANANSTSYASAIMKIILRYGFCHTIVLDKDSKFFWRLPQSDGPFANQLSCPQRREP